jgi:manganese transport protein
MYTMPIEERKPSQISLSEVNQTVDTTRHSSTWRRLFAFLGPAYLVSVGYMDPGNWATDLAGGSRYGYKLLWVLLMSNLIAVLLQSMCARLGIVARRDLAQASREMYPRWANYCLYFFAEIAIAATDLAEVVGMAIGLQLLFDLPLIWGVAISILDAFLLLWLMQWGIRKLEVFIIGLIVVIGGAFAVQMFLAKPDLTGIASGLIPSIPDRQALLIAIGIIGATVMPHNLYLHSALVQSRIIDRSNEGIKKALRFNLIDSVIALNLALFVNAAILILAAAVFHKNGYNGVSEIQDAHQLLEPLLGKGYAPILFAVALIAAGQSSTITGTLAGQIVMEGHIHLRIAPWLRRIITRLLAVIPAIVTITYFGEQSTGYMLVMSQVVLSMQLGFAIVPLLHYVSDKRRMGRFAISWKTKAAGWLSAVVIVALNINLVVSTIGAWISETGFGGLQIGAVVFLSASFAFLLYTIALPLMQHARTEARAPHGAFQALGSFENPSYQRIVVALDFSSVDGKVLQHAMAAGQHEANYLLIHAVETAGAIVMGADINDLEAESDLKNLQNYADNLKELGFDVEARIGYGSPRKVIAKAVLEYDADLLVLGAHGHFGVKDFIFGATANAVRHAVKIPVLIVK